MFRRSNNPSAAFREPHWTRLGESRLPGTPVRVQAWLADPGSLTRAIIATCRGRFRVEPVAQRLDRAWTSEVAMLGAGPEQATWIREVRLHCGRETWVFARTLMPMRSLRGPLRALTRLGRRPLGEVLFSDPTTRRLRVEVARITPRHHLFAHATVHLRRPPAAIWGRRTLFLYGGERILVNELFLPDVPVLKA